MNPILSIDYTKIKYQCVYFIKFTSNHFDKELFKIGVTMNLNDRLKNLRQEFKIDGNYKLLLAIPVESDEIEKDLLNAFEKRHPSLKIDLNICNNKKTECFIYSDSLLESINTVKLEFCKQTSKKYIENVEVVARDRQDCVNIDFEITKDVPWSLDGFNLFPKYKSSGIHVINMISDESLNISTKVITKNGVNYYNVSNWGDQIGKESKTYSKWARTDSAKENIKIAKEISGLDEVIISKKCYKIGDPRKTGEDSVDIDEQGSYLYDNLAVMMAMWVDKEFGIKIAKLINEGIKREIRLQYEDIIRQKDDKIDELIRSNQNIIRRTEQVLRDNQITHSKLDVVQEELMEARTDREEISAKLDKVTDMISDLVMKTS